jgi:hypothetical protein
MVVLAPALPVVAGLLAPALALERGSVVLGAAVMPAAALLVVVVAGAMLELPATAAVLFAAVCMSVAPPPQAAAIAADTIQAYFVDFNIRAFSNGGRSIAM